MSLMPIGDSSPFIKMRQVYWEARQAFKKSLGQREDSCIISSDSELDIRLELLQAADNYFNSLMRILLEYRIALQNFINTQDNLGVALIEYGTKDITAAGKLMCMCGKAISKAAQCQNPLKTSLMNLFHEVETFQFKATADALQTVAKMEKVRNSYRSGLLWMKKESVDLDPDVNKKLRNFRKVQEHIKHLKVRFDGVKLESMQKIDLFLLSRSNLFSHTLPPYCKTFKKMLKYSVIFSEFALKNIPLYLSYDFVALKELNEYSKALQSRFQKLNPVAKKQTKSKKIARNSKSESIINVLDKSYPSIDSGANSGDFVRVNKKHEPPQLEMSNNPGDTLLINLNETDYRTENNSKITIPSNKSISLPSSKYSEDLLLINFDAHKVPSNKVLSEENEKFREECESLMNLLDSAPQQIREKDPDELKFWSLIQNYGIPELSSKPPEDENLERKYSTLVPKKISSSVLSDSKWDEILLQFDPFGNESSKQKDNVEYI